MTAHSDLDRQLNDFLRDGPDELPYQSFDAVRDRTERTRQRVVFGPWRLPYMNKFVSIGLGAAAMILAVIVGAQLFGTPPGGVGADPTATASPEPTPEPTPSPTPEAGLPLGPFAFEDLGVGMTIEIPAPGWEFGEPSLLSKGVEVANLPEAAILFWGNPPGVEFYVPGDPCRATSTRPDTPATTVDELAAALAAQVSRDASEPVDVTIGGHQGKMVTLHVPDDAVTTECELNEFVSYGTAGDPLGRYHQGPGQIDELWLLDVDGTIVIIDATYRPDTSTDLVTELRGIVESTSFDP